MLPVEPTHPTVGRGNPEQPLAVLINILYVYTGQPIRNGVPVPQHMIKGFYLFWGLCGVVYLVHHPFPIYFIKLYHIGLAAVLLRRYRHIPCQRSGRQQKNPLGVPKGLKNMTLRIIVQVFI